jgi:hypothetical protein
MFAGLGLLFRIGELDKSSAHPKLKPALLTDEQYPWAKTEFGTPTTIKSNATRNGYLSLINENPSKNHFKWYLERGLSAMAVLSDCCCQTDPNSYSLAI